ncbi:hypothetical protein GYB62_03375 [bacterium]|nr:hypothetical protein [bacterium]
MQLSITNSALLSVSSMAAYHLWLLALLFLLLFSGSAAANQSDYAERAGDSPAYRIGAGAGAGASASPEGSLPTLASKASVAEQAPVVASGIPAGFWLIGVLLMLLGSGMRSLNRWQA